MKIKKFKIAFRKFKKIVRKILSNTLGSPLFVIIFLLGVFASFNEKPILAVVISITFMAGITFILSFLEGYFGKKKELEILTNNRVKFEEQVDGQTNFEGNVQFLGDIFPNIVEMLLSRAKDKKHTSDMMIEIINERFEELKEIDETMNFIPNNK